LIEAQRLGASISDERNPLIMLEKPATTKGTASTKVAQKSTHTGTFKSFVGNMR